MSDPVTRLKAAPEGRRGGAGQVTGDRIKGNKGNFVGTARATGPPRSRPRKRR